MSLCAFNTALDFSPADPTDSFSVLNCLKVGSFRSKSLSGLYEDSMLACLLIPSFF